MEVPHTGFCLKATLLDGAMGTNLYKEGMPHGICVEEFILNNPDIIKKLQSEFINAGSDIIYAPTFGANRTRLSEYGLGDKVDEFNTKLVELCRESAKDKLVAGDLSPTGLQIEPYGDTPFDEVVEVYNEQATALYNAGVDLFVIETMMSLTEARAAVLACRKFNKPIFVTFSIDEKGRTIYGSTALSCLITLQGLGISGFGFNCSNGPEAMIEQFKEISQFAKIPLIAKPNAGMPNPLLPHIYDLSPVKLAECIEKLLDLGVKYVGGCCGTTPEHIAEMRKVIDNHNKSNITENNTEDFQQNDFMLSNEREAFALDNDRLEFTDPIICEHDMADVLLSAEDDSFDILLIEINSEEDAQAFAENVHLSKLPVCFSSTDENALRKALFLYNGRAMVDIKSPIEEAQLKKIASEYGAVVY